MELLLSDNEMFNIFLMFFKTLLIFIEFVQNIHFKLELVETAGTYKVRNEIETKRNEINKNETKRNQRNENEIKRNQRKQNEINEKKTK